MQLLGDPGGSGNMYIDFGDYSMWSQVIFYIVLVISVAVIYSRGYDIIEAGCLGFLFALVWPISLPIWCILFVVRKISKSKCIKYLAK